MTIAKRIALYALVAFFMAACTSSNDQQAKQIASDKATIQALGTQIAQSMASPAAGATSTPIPAVPLGTPEGSLPPDNTSLPGSAITPPAPTPIPATLTETPTSPDTAIPPSPTPIPTNTAIPPTPTPIPTNTAIPPTPTPIPPAHTATPLPWPTDIPFEDLRNVPRVPGSALVWAADGMSCGDSIDVRVYRLPGPGDIGAVSQWYADALPTYGWLYEEFLVDPTGRYIYQHWREDTTVFPARLSIEIVPHPNEQLLIGGCMGSSSLPQGRPTDLEITVILSH